MTLEKIITQASPQVRLPFLAMVRSLRASGCHLPVWVIPYDDGKFELPEGCEWWDVTALTTWLASRVPLDRSRYAKRKYQCLLTSNYQFVDSDVIFLRNPATALEQCDGFVASCLHWSNPMHAITGQAVSHYQAQSTLWPARIFNAGQFACDVPLYTESSLIRTAEDPRYAATITDFRFHEQPGMNLLVHLSGVPVTNLTLPPHQMESSWAGDYLEFKHSAWTTPERTPYLLHWAGSKPDGSRAIDEHFLQYLDAGERAEWLQSRQTAQRQNPSNRLVSRLKRTAAAAVRAWQIQ